MMDSSETKALDLCIHPRVSFSNLFCKLPAKLALFPDSAARHAQNLRIRNPVSALEETALSAQTSLYD